MSLTASQEEIDASELVLHFLGEHAHTAPADMRNVDVNAPRGYEDEINASHGAEQGDLDSRIAKMRMGRHDRNMDVLGDELRRVKSA